MPRPPARRIALPLSSLAFGLLISAFILPGLVGHDPWKTEDAIGFGVLWQLLDGGSWLTPQLAGEPWYDDGPLYFWLAAAVAKTLSFVLPLHDGARFASAIAVLTALACVRLAARELYGKTQGDLSMIALMSCLGLMWHAHEVAPETAMLAGLAAAYYGLAIAYKKPFKSACFFGVGAGVAFLSKGLIALLQPLAAALLVLPLSAAFRARSYALAVGLGLLVLAPFVFIWPALLAANAPEYFSGWLSWQLASLTHGPSWSTSRDLFKMLAWAAWPIWPLTLWAIWEYRRYLRDPGFAVPFVAMAVSFVLLIVADVTREMDALALLIPLAIPAGAAAASLRRGAANALAWFGLMTFGLAASVAWVLWFAMMTGVPEQLAHNVAKLEPGFVPHFAWLPFAAALALSGGWVILALRSERSTLRALPLWAAGVALLWGLATSIWLAWIDYGKSYRTVAEGLAHQLSGSTACVESRGLGETQRAMFHYHARLITQRAELHGKTDCPFLLVQTARGRRIAPGAEWKRVWEGGRPRDRERYVLYRRL